MISRRMVPGRGEGKALDMIRLDKFLCDMNMGTRSQVKEFIRRGQVSVNGAVVKKPELKIQEDSDEVICQGQPCSYRRYAYYMLNKPAGVVSACRDNTADTVLDLLKGVRDRELFPAGRLDKDTQGLLLITNDGELAHRLLSPRHHVDKTYRVTLRQPLDPEALRRLEEGVDIGDEAPTLPARARLLSDTELILTIQEGRFHQVKRMLLAVGNEVAALKRESFGPLVLDPALGPGEFRELTGDEVAALKMNPVKNP